MGSLSQLLFPLACLICGDLGFDLCPSCDQKILRNSRNIYLNGARLWGAAYYCEELAQIILQAKEKNSAPARNFLVQLLVAKLMEVSNICESSAAVTLIPIPSRAAANRKRGFRHAYLLANELGSVLKQEGIGKVEVQEVLQVDRAIADQSNLNREQRAANIAGAYSIRSGRGRRVSQGGASVFLVDDLVTTGASTREGLRALNGAGIAPVAVLCAGVSPRLFS